MPSSPRPSHRVNQATRGSSLLLQARVPRTSRPTETASALRHSRGSGGRRCHRSHAGRIFLPCVETISSSTSQSIFQTAQCARPMPNTSREVQGSASITGDGSHRSRWRRTCDVRALRCQSRSLETNILRAKGAFTTNVTLPCREMGLFLAPVLMRGCCENSRINA